MSLTQNRIRARRLNSVWAMKQRRRACPHQYFTRIELGTTGVIAGIYHEAKKTCLRRSAAAGPSGGCSRQREKSGSYVSARMAEPGFMQTFGVQRAGEPWEAPSGRNERTKDTLSA